MAISKLLCVCALTLGTTGGAIAQQLVHKFNNPSFGGPAFNSGHLLGLAEIQQEHHDPVPVRTTNTGQNSATAAFIRQLESRLLSNLSTTLVADITGAEIGPPQTATIGETQITYERTPENLIVTITNLIDLSSTTLEIPNSLAPIPGAALMTTQ